MLSPHEKLTREIIEDDPVIQELFAEYEARGEARAKGRAEGRVEGKIEGLQEAILKVLIVRFPALGVTSQAQQAIASIEDLEMLSRVLHGLLVVSDEQTACRVLKLPVQGDLLW